MTLTQYLALKGNSATQLAKAMGVAPSTIYRAANGELSPTLGLMAAIHKHTGGKVTPNDFLESTNDATQ